MVAALNIANTMTMAIYERTKEIGVMKVLGCKLSKIRQMFLIEAGFIGLLGGIVGAVLSLLLSLVLNNINTWLQALAMFLARFGIVLQITNVDIGALFGMGGMGDMGGRAQRYSAVAHSAGACVRHSGGRAQRHRPGQPRGEDKRAGGHSPRMTGAF